MPVPACSSRRWRRRASSCWSARAATRSYPSSPWASDGIWTEAFGDVAVVPLPADAARVERALRSLRAAPLLEGTRTGAPVDVAAAAALAARAGALLLDQGLELLELNPVLVNARGAVAVDALVRTGSRAPAVAPRAATHEERSP